MNAKAESISDDRSASVMTDLRRKTAIAAGERSENMWEKQLCRQQGQWRRRGRRCSRHQSRDSPAACGEDHGEAGCPHAAHGGPRWTRSPPAALGEPHAGAGGCLKEAVTLWRTCAGAGSCQDLWPCVESIPGWSRFAGRICDPVGNPCWSSLFLKDCILWQGPTLEQFMGRTHVGAVCGGLSPMGGTPGWSRVRVWGALPLRRKEWQTQLVTNWLHPPFSVPLCCLERGGREMGSEVEPGKKGGLGGRCFKIWFYSSLPFSDLIGDKLN